MNAAYFGAGLALWLAGAGAEAAMRHADTPIPPDFAQPLASPGVHASGNECAPDRAEAAWSREGRLLGYYCVRPPSNAR